MNQKTLHIILLGAPGCGKGSLSEQLEKHYHIHHFSTGDMLRKAVKDGTSLGLKAAELIDQGKFVSDDIIMGLIRERLDKVRNKKENAKLTVNLFDGFPRTLPQAVALDQLLAETGEQVDTVISMECPEDIIAYRTRNRCLCPDCAFIGSIPDIELSADGLRHCPVCGGILYQRKDDRPEVFQSRMEAFYTMTEPLVSYYTELGKLARVDSSECLNKVEEEVRIILDALGQDL